MKNLWQIIVYCQQNNLDLDTYIKTLDDTKINEEYVKYLDRQQDYKIVALIREKYSENEEFEVQRKRDIEPEKFQEYYDYVEECIATIKGV